MSVTGVTRTMRRRSYVDDSTREVARVIAAAVRAAAAARPRAQPQASRSWTAGSTASIVSHCNTGSKLACSSAGGRWRGAATSDGDSAGVAAGHAAAPGSAGTLDDLVAELTQAMAGNLDATGRVLRTLESL